MKALGLHSLQALRAEQQDAVGSGLWRVCILIFLIIENETLRISALRDSPDIRTIYFRASLDSP